MLEVTLIYGFVNSTILALIALGFSLTFGISGVSNFAYGAFYVLAGYAVWIFMHQCSIPFVPAVILSVLLTSALGAALYRFVLLRVRGQVISEVIATFGVGLAILEMFRYLGYTGFEYTLPVFTDGSIMIGSTYVDHQRLWIVGVGIVLAVALYLFTHHTRLGLAFRGIAQDERTALISGDQLRPHCRYQRGLRVRARRGGSSGDPPEGEHLGERGVRRADQCNGSVHCGRPWQHGRRGGRCVSHRVRADDH